MKSSFIFIISSLLITSICCQSKESTMDRTIPFLNSTIHLTSKIEAQKLLGSSDEFSQSQGTFDFASKTQISENAGEADYLAFASEQAEEWSSKEIAATRKVVQEAQEKIQSLQLNIELPTDIQLVKSTCKEEGGAAGYTRQNFIVVRENPDLHLFLHELFHVLSRHDATLRTKLYGTIQFKPCERITFPDALKNIKITNPDAPFFEHYIQVSIDGEEKAVIFSTLSNRPYDGGSFFQYLDLKLLELNEDFDLLLKDGQVVSHDFNASSDLFDKIGKNTSYNIHPEEIMAEHFTYLVMGETVPEPSFIEEIRAIFTEQ